MHRVFIGEDGKESHNPNTVVSLLHHSFFHCDGHGEKQCFLHADNCAGQNKSKTLHNVLGGALSLLIFNKNDENELSFHTDRLRRLSSL